MGFKQTETNNIEKKVEKEQQARYPRLEGNQVLTQKLQVRIYIQCIRPMPQMRRSTGRKQFSLNWNQ